MVIVKVIWLLVSANCSLPIVHSLLDHRYSMVRFTYSVLGGCRMVLECWLCADCLFNNTIENRRL